MAVVTPSLVHPNTKQKLKTETNVAMHTKNNDIKTDGQNVVGEFDIENEYETDNEDASTVVEITSRFIDGGADLVKGQCKRIVFTYELPPNIHRNIVHSVQIQNEAPGKYVTWCGLFLKNVKLFFDYFLH